MCPPHTKKAKHTKDLSFGSSAIFCKTRRFPSPSHGGFGFVGTTPTFTPFNYKNSPSVKLKFEDNLRHILLKKGLLPQRRAKPAKGERNIVISLFACVKNTESSAVILT
jgi:hypothetical protein